MNFFRQLFGNRDRHEARAPSEQCPTTAGAIARLLEHHARDPDSWLTLIGESRVGTEVTIQVADDSINFLTTEVDLPTFLESLGLTALATTAGASDRDRVEREHDRSLWALHGATSDELVVVVDALFAQHFGLGADYRLTGWLER